MYVVTWRVVELSRLHRSHPWLAADGEATTRSQGSWQKSGELEGRVLVRPLFLHCGYVAGRGCEPFCGPLWCGKDIVLSTRRVSWHQCGAAR